MMILGLFCSRALLSVGIFVFFLAAPFRLGWRDWLRRAVSDPLVWILGSWWLLPVVSGLWSADQQAWMDIVRIKLPLLLLPMGWVGLSFTRRSFVLIGWTLFVLCSLGVLYSLADAFWGSTDTIQSYLSGKTLRTPLDNDRVRFSWLLVGILCWLQLQWHSETARMRSLIIGLSVFLVLFLHVLAVRIGLLCLYMLVFFWLVRMLSNPDWRKWAVVYLLILFLSPVMMYFFLPTFRARVDYIRYDWSYTMQGKYLPGGNDAIRVQSLQVAGAVLCDHPVVGVGFGDIRSAMEASYQQVTPGLSATDRIYPANEWAVYGVGMGWVGLISFTATVFSLFFVSSTNVFLWRGWVLATVLSMVTDIGLEVQYGVFLIPFLLLFFRQSSTELKNQEIRG